MSQASTVTLYQIQHNITQTATGNSDSWSLYLELPAWTDASIGAFVQALEAVPLPPGCTSQVIVGKSTSVTTVFTTDTATNPITFT